MQEPRLLLASRCQVPCSCHLWGFHPHRAGWFSLATGWILRVRTEAPVMSTALWHPPMQPRPQDLASCLRDCASLRRARHAWSDRCGQPPCAAKAVKLTQCMHICLQMQPALTPADEGLSQPGRHAAADRHACMIYDVQMSAAHAQLWAQQIQASPCACR